MAKSKRNLAWNGMNWIRQEKRLAIYLRDGLACAYCGATVEDGATMSLDHVKCHINGGTNKETNLVTACLRCNDSRGKRSVSVFARVVAKYVNHGVTAKQVQDHVRDCCQRPLPMAEAKKLMARRGSAAKVLAHLNRGKR